MEESRGNAGRDEEGATPRDGPPVDPVESGPRAATDEGTIEDRGTDEGTIEDRGTEDRSVGPEPGTTPIRPESPTLEGTVFVLLGALLTILAIVQTARLFLGF